MYVNKNKLIYVSETSTKEVFFHKFNDLAADINIFFSCQNALFDVK